MAFTPAKFNEMMASRPWKGGNHNQLVETADKPPTVQKQNKYRAKKVMVDNIRFDSQLEANYYLHLKMLQRVGEVAYFHRQVPFDLEAGVTYYCDFQVFYAAGAVRYIDTKSEPTAAKQEFRNKRKQVEYRYPVKIEIVMQGDF